MGIMYIDQGSNYKSSWKSRSGIISVVYMLK